MESPNFSGSYQTTSPQEQKSREEVLHFEAGLNSSQNFYSALFMLLESISHAVTSVIRSVLCSFLNIFIWKDQQLINCITQGYNYYSFTEYKQRLKTTVQSEQLHSEDTTKQCINNHFKRWGFLWKNVLEREAVAKAPACNPHGFATGWTLGRLKLTEYVCIFRSSKWKMLITIA